MPPDPPARRAQVGPQARGLSPGTRERLLTAWEAWDSAPSARVTAEEMIDSVRVVAVELAVPALALRDALTVARRDGLASPQALDYVIAHFPASPEKGS